MLAAESTTTAAGTTQHLRLIVLGASAAHRSDFKKGEYNSMSHLFISYFDLIHTYQKLIFKVPPRFFTMTSVCRCPQTHNCHHHYYITFIACVR